MTTYRSGQPGRIPQPAKVGDRIRLVAMGADEKNPIPPGSFGTVTWVNPIGTEWQIAVAWEDKTRSLMLSVPPDLFEIVPVSWRKAGAA